MNFPSENQIPSPEEKSTVRIFGVGGAGGNAVAFMAGTGACDCALFSVNSDAAALSNCRGVEAVHIGRETLRGMGAGGEPEIARSAAEADADRLRELCEGAKIVVILAGLGGGTGTGASSVLARVAKDAGAHVLAVVTLPFDFESGRRQRQALLGFQQLKGLADAVVCLPNQKIFQLINDQTTVTAALQEANRVMAEGVQGMTRLFLRTGIINADFADLASVANGFHAETSFATAQAEGANRDRVVLEKLFAHPLFGGGRMLEEAGSMLVSIGGGSDLTMAEVNRVMLGIQKHCDDSHIIFGACIEENLANRLAVTIVATGKVTREERAAAAPRAPRQAVSAPISEIAPQLLDPSDTSRPPSRMIAPVPELTEVRREQLLGKQNGTRAKKSASRLRQNELPLEIISKGRFEKSEPTIHRGEDLDLPTYIRRGIALN